MTVRFADMTEVQKREVRMYGCTQDQMREAVEQSLTYRFSGAAMYAMSMMSDAQELVAYGPYDSDTLANILEDQRQLLIVLNGSCQLMRWSRDNVGF